MITRTNRRDYFSVEGSPVKYSRVTREFPGGQIHSVISRIPPGFRSEEVSHEGEELVYIISGDCYFQVGEEKYDLSAGDSIHLKSTQPHQWGNAGKSELVTLSVNTMPLFKKK